MVKDYKEGVLNNEDWTAVLVKKRLVGKGPGSKKDGAADEAHAANAEAADKEGALEDQADEDDEEEEEEEEEGDPKPTAPVRPVMLSELVSGWSSTEVTFTKTKGIATSADVVYAMDELHAKLAVQVAEKNRENHMHTWQNKTCKGLPSIARFVSKQETPGMASALMVLKPGIMMVAKAHALKALICSS